jgi:hypothetical protein
MFIEYCFIGKIPPFKKDTLQLKFTYHINRRFLNIVKISSHSLFAINLYTVDSCLFEDKSTPAKSIHARNAFIEAYINVRTKALEQRFFCFCCEPVEH